MTYIRQTGRYTIRSVMVSWADWRSSSITLIFGFGASNFHILPHCTELCEILRIYVWIRVCSVLTRSSGRYRSACSGRALYLQPCTLVVAPFVLGAVVAEQATHSTYIRAAGIRIKIHSPNSRCSPSNRVGTNRWIGLISQILLVWQCCTCNPRPQVADWTAVRFVDAYQCQMCGLV